MVVRDGITETGWVRCLSDFQKLCDHSGQWCCFDREYILAINE